MSYQLPPLNYETNALEPHIDAKTMEIHHDKHHNAYVTNLNNAVAGTEYDGQELADLMKKITKDTPPAVRNNGGGHFNHSLFWEVIKPGGANAPSGALLEKINSDLGGVEKFKEDFAKAAATRFGSGWAWLCVTSDGKLCVCSSPNQDNPLMGVSECPGTPILGLDVWEHAYYLNYQNRRPDYIKAFWSVVNWDEVAKRYQAV